MKERSGITPLRRTVAGLLTLVMCLSILPLQVLAAEQDTQILQGELPAVIPTQSGELTVQENTEDWNEVYPYGTFAFGGYQADVGESGAKTAKGEAISSTVRIPVYRLGGTQGRVTAWITYAPSVTVNADGSEELYDYAASALDDVLVEYEDPNPIAAYQELGLPRWGLDMQPGGAAVCVKDENDEVVTVALPDGLGAESFRWQVRNNGVWDDVYAEEEQGPTMELEWSTLWDSENNCWNGVDLRCVWLRDGKAFCSESLLGEVYEPIEAVKALPADVKSVAEPGYTALEADEAFGAYEFPLTFAEGETVKYVRVTALEDDISELPELGLFTITRCEGGKLSDTSNTLTVMISDGDEDGPSALGFAAQRVSVSRGSSAVRAAVKREGDKSYNVTVRYETKDGSAKAGVDYAAASGVLSFAGSIDDVEIPVELIANDATEDREFSIVLTELQGGGEAQLCKLRTREITVNIAGYAALPPDGSGRNLATVLVEPDGEQVAAVVSDGALLTDNSEPMQANVRMDEPEELTAELVYPEQTGANGDQPLSHLISAKYKLTRSNTPGGYDGYWKDWECLIDGGEYNTTTTARTSQKFTDTSMEIIDPEHFADFAGGYGCQPGTRSGIYKGLLTHTERPLQIVFDKVDDGFKVGGKVYAFGDYFRKFKMDVEWHAIGLYKTAFVYDCHRYLRPAISYALYNSDMTNYRASDFDFTTGSARSRDVNPPSQTIRAFTKGNGWGEVRGSAWANAEPENQGMSGADVDFGQDLTFQIAQYYCHTWNNELAPIVFGLCDQGSGENGDSEVDIRRLEGQRRSFNKTDEGIDLTLYTANDADEMGGSYSSLSANSALYGKLAPTVSLVSDKSGVTASGELYLGSRIKVTLPNVEGYSVPDNGVWMENSAHGKVGYVENAGGGVYYITLMWNGIDGDDVDAYYSLHVMYDRRQTVILDISPSVPRLAGSSDIDPSQVRTTWYSFIAHRPTGVFVQTAYNSAEGRPMYLVPEEYILYSESTGPGPGPGYTAVNVDGCFFESNGEYELESWFSPIYNIQSINFHLPHEDVIVFNGKGYAGDEEIVLTEEDLALTKLRFSYYSKAFQQVVSPMKTYLEYVELYFDRDGDGAISGSFEQGVFAVDESRDSYLGIFKGDYPESTFQPVLDENGVIHRYYLKVFYSARARSYQTPPGADPNKKAQILPAFYNAITDDSGAYLAPEEKSCLWISGLDNAGNVVNNVDDKPMYGAEPSQLSYVDIPLGGDVSPVILETKKTVIREPDEYEPVLDANGNQVIGADGKPKQKLVRQGHVIDSYTEATYTWHPNYVGTLLVPFEHPTPVYNEDNATKTKICMADENVLLTDAGYQYSAAGLKKMNGYLGSFVGRSGFALGIQQQEVSSDQIHSLDQVQPETLTTGTVFTTPSDDSLAAQDVGGDSGTAEGEGPGEAIDREEFAPDLGTELPSLEFELGDYATIVMDGYEVGFTIGLPIFQHEDANYYSTDSSGNEHSKTTSEDGKTVTETIRSKDGKTVTEIKTVEDPNDPNKQTVTTKITEKRDNGRVVTKNEEQKRKKNANGDWEDDGAATAVTDNPSTPSNSQTLGENFQETSGMNTLRDFCKAVHGKHWDDLKNLSNGKFLGDDYEQAKSGQNKCRKVSFTFNVQLAIMFEYNPIDNCHYFKSAGVSLTAGVEFTAHVRLAAWPFVYVYLKMGVEIEAAFSLSCSRNAVEGDLILSFTEGSPEEMLAGTHDVLEFELDMRKNTLGARGFHMDLNGSVYMAVYDPAKPTDNYLTTGFLTGDGGQKEVLFEEYDKIVRIRLWTRGTSWPEILNIKPVLRADSLVVFDGITLTPTLSMEVGAGIGVELLKAEVFLKTSIAITMTTAGYLEQTGNVEGLYMSGFDWSIALGARFVLLYLTFEMDVIAFGVEGAQSETGGYFTWDIAASSFNGMVPIWSKTTYTTYDAKGLDEPVEAEGINLHRGFEEIKFFNPDGKPTNTKDNAGNGEGWYFDDHVWALYWGGGDYLGQSPLEHNLAVARKSGSTVKFTTGLSTISVYFEGKINVETAVGITTCEKSPAKIEVGTNGGSVKITALKEGTKLDRYCEYVPPTPSTPGNQTIPRTAAPDVGSAEHSLVRVRQATDISGTQQVFNAYADSTRAITPTATSDFQLSGYNTSGDAKKLVGNLSSGYSYKLAQAGDNSYLVYPLMISGKPQLVLSRLVMTGDLTGAGTGLLHPLDPENETPYLLLDDDGFTDLDFSLQGDENSLTVSWVSYADENGESCSVKRRTVDLGANLPGSTEQLDLADSFRYAPAVNGGKAVWAEAEGSGESDNAMLKAWLLAKYPGLTETMLDELSVQESQYANPVFHWATQSRMNKTYGDGTVLRAETGESVQITGRVENVETAKIGNKTYILYTTAQPAYFDASLDTPVTVNLDGVDGNTERGTIYRLYLRALDRSGFGEAKLLQTVIDFDGCSESNIAEAKLKDGVYIAGTRASTKADPYFANLRFVTADIDGTGEQTLALYEMGGNSYLISERDVKGATSSSAAVVTLQPIFTETSGMEVNIGSDGKNLAAVYTAPMTNSSSNAIYVAWWDPNLQAWGAPAILAMRHLQVYEDAISFDLSSDELREAYLGRKTGNEAYDAHLASLSGQELTHAAGSMDQLAFSNLQMAAHVRENEDGTESKQLLVLTEGSFTKLQDFSFDMGEGKEPFVTVVPESESKVGFYAIAFGEGEQALGEASFGLASYDFAVGSRLVGELSFTNTGTTAIRASEANPNTIRLFAGSQQIATWHLTESIPSGRTTRLTFTGLPLTESLSTGTKFSLTVQEDGDYFGENAFYGELPELFTVEEKPELSFGSFKADFNRVTGNTALLDFSAEVLNNGSGDAGEVFLQFSCGTGEKDDSGEEIYHPVDITGSSFITSQQQPILRQAVSEDYTQGVYRLKDENGETNLDRNYYRTVSGALCVPTSCFASKEDYSGLHLRVEIFSDADDPDLHYGVYTSEHNEYNASNNRAETIVKHHTVFNMPDRIVTALGTTMMLPLSFECTSPNPDIVLTELTDGTEGWSPRLGVCYYDPDRQVIVAAPNSTAQAMLDAGQSPTGILQVKDRSTNTVCAIVYRVGAMGEGVNIYRDDASFRFFNADGTPAELYPDPQTNPNPDWRFLDWATSDGWIGGAEGEIPMNNDLTLANRDGVWFSFDTVASKLKLCFAGKLTVECGGVSQTITDSGTEVDLNNPLGELRTVKVTAQKGTLIDRYVGSYATNPVADADPNAPQILWNRSFPDTASILPGGSVPTTCYILDAGGLQSVRFNGQTLTESTTPALVKADENLWYFDYTFTDNGVVNVRAFDAAGNSSGGNVAVSWFNDVLSSGAVAGAPELTREHLSFVDEAGSPVDVWQTITAAPYLKSAYETQEGENSSAYFCDSGAFSSGALAKSTGERWLAGWNGYYQVRIDRPDGTWARAVLPMTALDLTPPSSTLRLPGSGTPADPYRIGSLSDWQELESYVFMGNETAGLCFLQTADFTVDNGAMIGTGSSYFRGSYDGGGHTLIFRGENAPSDFAPFRYVQDASFRNLHIAGSITTNNKFAAGLAANVLGGCTVVNCRSSITIRSEINGDGTHGGFFAVVYKGSELTMTGCTFDGAVYGAGTTRSGGFVGCNKSTIRFTDCLCAPQTFEWSEQCYAFCRNNDGATDSGTDIYTNCYYTLAPNDAQGLQARSVRAGENVSLDFGVGTAYSVARITAYAPGLWYNSRFIAGTGETVALVPQTALPKTQSVYLEFSATDGTLSSDNGVYSFIPAQADAVVNVVTTLRLEGSGTENDPYRIGSSEEWTLFTEYVNAGYPTEDVCFLQTADIDAATGAGTENAPFRGVYDGGGKTMNLSLSADAFCVAPFSRVSGVTIKNLVVTGTVSGGYHSAGLVGGVQGAAENRIENCAVFAQIGAKSDYIAGFLGHGGDAAKTSVVGCLFDGELNGATHAATFWGWSEANTTPVLTDCLDRSSSEYPIGLGWPDPTGNVTNVWYAAPEKTAGAERPWSRGNRGVHGCTVTPGANVALDFGAASPSYNVSGIGVLASGVLCDGKLYTGADASVSLTPGYKGTDPDNAESFFLASSGEFTPQANGVYRLKLAGANTEINIGTHDWNAPVYRWSADHRTVTATRSCRHNSAHVQTETVVTDGIETAAPTCILPGTSSYTASFWSSVFENQTATADDIAALGHEFGAWTLTTAPSCTGQGVETQTCVRCDATQTHSVDALGHDYAFDSWIWNEDFSRAEARLVCKRDASHTDTLEAAISREYIGASCDEPGTVVYTARAELGGETLSDVRSVELEVLGHDWSEPSYVWAEDCSSVTARAVCQRDPTHVLEEKASTNFILTKPSTFEKQGAGYYAAEFQSAVFAPQSREIVIPEVACAGGDSCPGRSFTDMPPISSYAHIPIDWAVLNRVTSGMTPTSFKPNSACTRAQFVTFLWRTMSQPEPASTETSFTDVKPGSFYYKAVLWAVEQGITNGMSATSFKPNALVTRGQVVTFLWRAEGQPEPSGTENVFTDVSQSAFYYKAMLWAVEKDITKGMTATTFVPGGSCIRAQVVTFLYREFGN